MTIHTSTHEPHDSKSLSKSNWLRAAVLGANDGIVSIAGLVVGVAGATTSISVIATAGVAGLLAGALSMAVGEYVSVNTQRDTEKALLEKEAWELKHLPEEELAELAHIYEQKGLSKKTASIVAKELTAHDAFAAHVDAELGIDPDNLTNAWHAAYASALAFTAGAIIPLAAIVLSPVSIRVPATFIAVLVALAITGFVSARAGGSSARTATVRVVIGGMLAMIVTYSVGHLFNIAGI